MKIAIIILVLIALSGCAYTGCTINYVSASGAGAASVTSTDSSYRGPNTTNHTLNIPTTLAGPGPSVTLPGTTTMPSSSTINNP